MTITALQPRPTDTNFFERADMEDTRAGEGKKDDPAKVAKQGFEALMDSNDHVVAGSFKNKAQATVANILPQTVNPEVHRKMTKLGSGNKKEQIRLSP
ncbi:MAG TPA: hypothetical protein VFU22_22325 [Roseiflexaceae bacterium]|nr:hypothetical protein [Roseiflexaceae bacterium]